MISRITSRVISPSSFPASPPVIVQNMPGAGGLTALGSLYNSGPFDGTRIMLTSPSHTLAQITGSKSVRYDILKMNVIGTLTQDTQACAASGRSGVRSITEASTKELIFGATGASSTAAQHERLLANLLGYKIRIVTGYQGTAQMRLAMETRRNFGDLRSLGLGGIGATEAGL